MKAPMWGKEDSSSVKEVLSTAQMLLLAEADVQTWMFAFFHGEKEDPAQSPVTPYYYPLPSILLYISPRAETC